MEAPSKSVIEWVVLDVLGISLLTISLTGWLQGVELAVGVLLIVYNAIRIYDLIKKKKNEKDT